MTERGEPRMETAGPGQAAREPAAPDTLTPEHPVHAAPEHAASSAAAVAGPEHAVPDGAEPAAAEPAGSAEEEPAHRVSTWNIANVLTIARLVVVPVFVAFLFVEGEIWRLAALGVFLLASFTDQLDGWLARKYALVTDFGKIADPIADKALIGAALLSLSYLGELPWWVTLVIIAREAGVTLLRFLVIRHGVIPASYGGKVKTVLQILAIALYIVPGVPGPARWAAMGLAVAVTVGTGADYVVRAVRLRQVARRARSG